MIDKVTISNLNSNVKKKKLERAQYPKTPRRRTSKYTDKKAQDSKR